jgi:hypothetical protein
MPNQRVLAIACVTTAVAMSAVAQTSVDQPLLRAPWQGAAVITQGNHGSRSHNTAKNRTLDPDNALWENTYALDIAQLDQAGKPQKFDVLAPAAGIVEKAKLDTSGMGGRQLHLRVQGANQRTFILVFMHLSDIKSAYRNQGAIVQAGDIIATAGGSGNNTETAYSVHLHFHIFGTGTTPDSHTQGMNRLRIRRSDLPSFQDYESKGDGTDDPTRPELEHVTVVTRTFISDNLPKPTQVTIINGDFEKVLTSTNTAPDGSWSRVYYRGTDFAVLRGGGTWGRNRSLAYMYLGAERNSLQRVESKAFVVPASSASLLVRYYASVITEETAAYPYDTLRVTLVDVATGSEIRTLRTFTNERPTAKPGMDVALSYAEQAVRLFGVAGKTVKLRFEASNDAMFATWFRIDDVSASVE